MPPFLAEICSFFFNITEIRVFQICYIRDVQPVKSKTTSDPSTLDEGGLKKEGPVSSSPHTMSAPVLLLLEGFTPLPPLHCFAY